MKTFKILLSFAALTMLAACASGGSTYTQTEYKYVVDHQKIAAVEAAAQRTGVDVVWVSRPLKKVPNKPD